MKTTNAPQVFKQGRHIIAYEPGPYRGTGLWVWYELEVSDGPGEGVHATAPNCQELQRPLNQHMQARDPNIARLADAQSAVEQIGERAAQAQSAVDILEADLVAARARLDAADTRLDQAEIVYCALYEESRMTGASMPAPPAHLAKALGIGEQA